MRMSYKDFRIKFLLLVLLLACKTQDQCVDFQSLDIDDWNKKTIGLLENKLNISQYDYKDRNAPSPYVVTMNEKKYYTISGQLNEWMKRYRSAFLKELINQQIKMQGSLYVIEHYYQDHAYFDVGNLKEFYELKYTNDSSEIELNVVEPLSDDAKNLKAMITGVPDFTDGMDKGDFLSFIQLITEINCKDDNISYNLISVWFY